MRRPVRVLGPLVVGAALLATSACGGSSDSAPSPLADAPLSPSSSPTSTGSPSTDVTPATPSTDALEAGRRTWAAFSAADLPYEQWWAQLEPLLARSARATYVYDDPRNLPDLALTGALTLAAKAPDQAGFTATVRVPTGSGTFGLDLERHTKSSPWLLYAIDFPAGVQ